MENTYSQEQLIEIFNNEIRNMIVRLLRIYTELSLTQLSEIMSMNKTTIQYHLMLLRENKIVYVSRESQEDSRGSIPTKYYQLKYNFDRYRTNFADIKKIEKPQERIAAYKTYMQSLYAGLKDVKNQITYAENAIEISLKLIEEYSTQKLTESKLIELDEGLDKIRSGLTSFSTTKKYYSKIVDEIPSFYERFEKMQKEQNEIETEGYEIITLTLPLVNLIKSKLENKKKLGSMDSRDH
ncbi:MAG: ArsR/SmtB family transcription factor [Candidatus Thorarchaeota archaeon]